MKIRGFDPQEVVKGGGEWFDQCWQAVGEGDQDGLYQGLAGMKTCLDTLGMLFREVEEWEPVETEGGCVK